MLKNALAATVASLVAVSAVAAAQDTTATKPNIIFILADDLGYGELGCYGQKKINTPRLDKMAAEGIRFTNCYSGSTVCAPSRASLLTGNHSGHGNVRGNGGFPLLEQENTVAELLKSAGYSTAVIGKWGMGQPGTSGVPEKHGFDYSFGYYNHTHAHNYYTDHLFRNSERVDLPKGTYTHDLFTSESVAYIKEHKDKPFFLYLGFTIPHQKLQVPSEGEYADKDWPQWARKQAAMISRLDASVGSVLDAVKESGISDNTLVFFTSDNGPHKEDGADTVFFESNGPLRGIKRDLYEGGIRVPMIAQWPGKIKQGQVSDQPWAFWDFLPTAAELVGVPTAAPVDGVSVAATLTTGKSFKRPPLYWEFYEKGFEQAVRDGDYKILKTSKTLELYNVASDPGEEKDLASAEPERLAAMKPLLTTLRTEHIDWPSSGPEYQKWVDKRADKRKNKRK